MPLPTAYFWNKAPFVRLLVALIAGIFLQWHFQFSIFYLSCLAAISFLMSGLYFFIPVTIKYRYGYINGLLMNLLMVLIGAILVWIHDIRHNGKWIGKNCFDSCYVVATIKEPLVEKANSFKALASIDIIYLENRLSYTEGKAILYFKKDSSVKNLEYGSQIIFNKPLQEIRNSGNPGSFDYKRYSL